MAKHLLYLTNTQLTATLWDKGIFSPGQTFDNYASGWQKFTAYMHNHQDVPAYVLTDLIEEDFQRESIPHVFGPARKNLIERRLTALYRDTPYRKATYYGREKEGRKDDRMLFSALTNAPLLKPWFDVLLKEEIAVAGIYSVALLSPLLFKKLGLGNGPALLVTHQSSGLRQSYFQDGELRFSRLTPETAWSAQAIAEIAESEMAKTRQFLASTRLMARGADIDIVVVADAETISYLQPLCPDAAGMTYRFIDLGDARQVFGFPKLVDTQRCDELFLSLLAGKRVASHYATFEQVRLYSLSQARTVCNVLSIGTIVGALAWAGVDGLDALRADRQTREAQADTKVALARYQSAATSMPVTVANPHDMRAAVDLERMITQNAPRPATLIAQLSQALDKQPEVKVDELRWEASDAVPVAPGVVVDAPPPGEVPQLQATMIGIPKRPTEIITLDAEIAPFKNDYRNALDIVRKLTLELQKDKQVQVEITKSPLDVRPSVKLETNAGDDELLASPKFSLKLVWKP